MIEREWLGEGMHLSGAMLPTLDPTKKALTTLVDVSIDRLVDSGSTPDWSTHGIPLHLGGGFFLCDEVDQRSDLV